MATDMSLPTKNEGYRGLVDGRKRIKAMHSPSVLRGRYDKDVSGRRHFLEILLDPSFYRVNQTVKIQMTQVVRLKDSRDRRPAV